ncbi:hypothetical protein BD324DRAFT_648471 [Kockovaella imperatae]|uniref:Uncharacterized protein n=1 Tax=Kockovaella imperatae TaxID=4999 RepID=A0A1Y1UP90_9TREE|nr:hypothetical protein BD324DRAFT_648471 [Kockovaella imperatae]ORX39851.1 hypothetical protein BD324DRAFT_648471 [Kockovaella imperatae]
MANLRDRITIRAFCDPYEPTISLPTPSMNPYAGSYDSSITSSLDSPSWAPCSPVIASPTWQPSSPSPPDQRLYEHTSAVYAPSGQMWPANNDYSYVGPEDQSAMLQRPITPAKRVRSTPESSPAWVRSTYRERNQSPCPTRATQDASLVYGNADLTEKSKKTAAPPLAKSFSGYQLANRLKPARKGERRTIRASRPTVFDDQSD